MADEFANALQGKRVLVTRALQQAESLVSALRNAGAEPVVVPMLAFAPPDDPNVVDQAIRGASHCDWMLLTSQNALRALQERAESMGIDLAKILTNVSIAAVGPATAEIARNAALKVDYVALKHRGVELAEELGSQLRGKRIFLPRSDRANPELVQKLNELGAQVSEIVAYRTVRPDDQLAAQLQQVIHQGVHAVLFFSPSAVHHLRDVLGREKFHELSRRSVFVAIGPITEKALRTALTSNAC